MNFDRINDMLGYVIETIYPNCEYEIGIGDPSTFIQSVHGDKVFCSLEGFGVVERFEDDIHDVIEYPFQIHKIIKEDFLDVVIQSNENFNLLDKTMYQDKEVHFRNNVGIFQQINRVDIFTHSLSFYL